MLAPAQSRCGCGVGASLGDERFSGSCLVLGGIMTSGGTVIRNEWLGSLPFFHPLGQPLGFSLAEKAPQNVLLVKCENPLRWIRRLGHGFEPSRRRGG